MTKYSVHVGINNYPMKMRHPDADSGSSDFLVGCTNDAKDWERAVSVKFKFDSSCTLIDEAATKDNILRAVSSTIRGLHAGDLFLLTFSGYGTWIPNKEDLNYRLECVCPWDVGTSGALITDTELYEIFAERPKNSRIVFVDDSSHFGDPGGYAPLLTEQLCTHRIRYLPPTRFTSYHKKISAKMLREAVAYDRRMTSMQALLVEACKNSEYGWESDFAGRPNGVLTYAMLKTAIFNLQTIKTFGDLYRIVRTILPNPVSPQTPQVQGPRKWEQWPLFA